MTLMVRVERFGPEALVALRDEIAAAQGDDPLAPVTVVVARSNVGLAVRRVLASGAIPTTGPARPGIANVRFLTLARLADQLATPVLAASGRRPATYAVQRAAVRAGLAAAASGPFGGVRLHPATERSLQAVITELRPASTATLARAGRQSARAAEVTRLAADVRARLSAWYDQHDLVDAAATVATDDPARVAAELGAVVVYLPGTLTAPERRLLVALGSSLPVTLLLGATGEASTDEPVRELAHGLATADPPTLPAGAMAHGTSVVSAPDPDAEVLLALRGVMQRRHDGMPFERMAIVHGGVDPYPRLLHESLALAGIPSNGGGVRPLSATLVGRTLLGALALGDRGWRRDDVMAWIAGAPIRFRGSEVNATAWDRISREAGVTAGLDAFLHHLEAHAEALDAEVERLGALDDERSEGRRGRRARDLEQCRELTAFLTHLSQRLAPDPAPTTWHGWQRWADRFLRDHLGGWASWPEGEEQAFTEIETILGGLSVLDQVDPDPDAGTFRRALTAELDAPAPQTTRFGRGVLVARYDQITGLDLDTVFVVGMAEGIFPTRVRDDALLPDDERIAAGGDIPLRASRVQDARRAYLAGLAAAGERVLSYARGDQRRGREQRPSRWWLDTLDVLAGADRRLFSRDLPTLGPVDGFTMVPSFTAAVRSLGEPSSLADRDLRSLLHWFDRTGRLDRHPLLDVDHVLSLGLEARHGRQGEGFTRFDGRVDPRTAPSADAHGALSPTSLESYAICPRRYFFSKVLWIAAPVRPEDIQRISAMDRGSLIHAVLERFIGEQVARPAGDRIQPHASWTDAHRARLDAITDEVCAHYEQHGLTGRPLLWELDRADISRDLHTFLDVDDAYRANQGVVPEAVELQFGPEDGAPVAIRLSDGRDLVFRGMADRIDRAADGSAVVLDYKTGSDFGFRAIEGDDPVVRGTKLQLPIYGLAARGVLGDVPVRSAYWFLSERGGFRQIGYDLDGALERFHEAIEVIVGGIEAGSYPARPGAEETRRNTFDNCTYCDFDRMCPPDRDRAWDRMRRAPELADYVALAEGGEP